MYARNTTGRVSTSRLSGSETGRFATSTSENMGEAAEFEDADRFYLDTGQR